jgi:CheY-like chemotaxis protein
VDRTQESQDPVRVLIVDADADVRSYVRSCLEREGFSIGRIEEVADGQAALQLVIDAADSLQLVITEVSLPSMSGLTLAREIRLLRASPPPAVLLLTGEFSRRDASLRAAEVGAQGALTKPFNSDKLCSAVLGSLHSRAPPAGEESE